ncbi:hypothetical protein BC943DRAFT_319152 [Umbelopsis sp. AD052]|nr:hypothetical protein BC943DRAFT_319152 [Umbelopsis sp. AD052]
MNWCSLSPLLYSNSFHVQSKTLQSNVSHTYRQVTKIIVRVILFDSYLASNYITPNRQERETVPIVKYLRSSLGRKSSQLDMLSAPNLTTGISAAIMTYCELHQLPCVALFTLQESSLGKALITDETTAAFTTALENLEVACPSLDYGNLRSILRGRKFGKDSGRIDADHHRMYT